MSDHETDVPIPPTDAERHATACRYCIVGCAYEVYKWPVGEEGGPTAEENALGIDYPATQLQGQGVTTNQHTVIEEDGQKYNVIVKPDDESPVNNNWSKGDHSIRGGSMANSLYGPGNPHNDDRLKRPRIRIDGDLQPVDWDTAIEAVAAANRIAMEQNGPNGVGMKLYFYQFMENTYAGTKLMFDVIGSPNWGGHNRPALTPENPGMRNAGLWQFAYAYEDTRMADNVMIVGAEPYENQSIIFQEHIHDGVANNDVTPIYVQPRRTFTANYTENNGGEFLQVNEATDAVLLNSIARHIVDRGWENTEFIDEWTMDGYQIDLEGWYQEEFGLGFEEYKSFLQDKSLYAPENAAELTGVPAEQIRTVAELIGKPQGGEHPRTTFLWEKGLIWGWSHENSAAMGNLVLLTGSVGKPGAGLSRLGGHQEGFWVGGPAGDVIAEHSTQTFETSDGEEVTIAPNTIERVKGGEISHWHVIGCDPVRQSYNTDQLQRRVEERTRATGIYPRTAEIDEIERAFRERMDAGGLVITNQEMYARDTAEFADILLPATSWGEESTYHRWNGDRRLRHYSGFMEGPGEAKPDWEIFKLIGQEMGATDMDWSSSEEIFNEIAAGADHGPHAHKGIHEKARDEGKTAAEVVAELDTTGARMPITYEDGELQETPRVHTPDEETPGSGRFYTSTGRAIFMRSDWDRVKDVYDQIKPSGDEIWVTDGRINRLWQNLYTHMRDPHIIKRFEQNFIELHPEDAARFGVEAGDLVEVRNDDVYNMFGENTEGSFTAIAYVSEDPPQGQIVPQGTAFTYWLYPDQEKNDITPAYVDPANPNPAYKYSTGRIVRLGESELKEEMSFLPRNVAPE